MIHAEHFAAIVNIKTKKIKPHMNCLAIVRPILLIIIEMQNNSIVLCYEVELSEMQPITKTGMLFKNHTMGLESVS